TFIEANSHHVFPVVQGAGTIQRGVIRAAEAQWLDVLRDANNRERRSIGHFELPAQWTRPPPEESRKRFGNYGRVRIGRKEFAATDEGNSHCFEEAWRSTEDGDSLHSVPTLRRSHLN